MKKLSTLLMLAFTMLMSLKVFSVPKLSSYPSATATIFLDFDGHYVSGTLWNNGNPINCAPSGMTDAQITEAFNRVAEDYRPFNVNITTDSIVFLAAPMNQRIRMIITPSSAWCPGVGGVAIIGSFTWGDDTPGFVFNDQLGPNSPKMVGECIAHESGHTLGLDHQSKYDPNNCNYLQEYNSGVGGGEIGWAPIMGNSYYRNFSNWNNGPTPWGCTAVQDNLETISTMNGFGYRTDDYTETMNASTYTLPSGNFSSNGIITTNADKDAFRMVLARNSNIHITAVPGNVGANYIGANLDIKLNLYNSTGTLIRTYDQATTLGVTIDTILLTGTYYLIMDGTGNAYIGEYGSLGSYTLSGSNAPLPIRDVTLTGNADKGKHNLSWKIIADEPIKSIVVESSTNGVTFSKLANVASTDKAFSYTSYLSGTIFYRIKVTSVIDQTVYSNTIAITATGSTDKSFFVSTLVQNEISVNAPVSYQYVLNDLNGSIISTGKGVKGVNKINTSSLQSGMYFIQLINNNNRQTERIIKQ